MAEPVSDTILMQQCLDRLRAGDASARAELIRCSCERLTRLTRKMFRDYPGVARWEQTGDVFQNAMLRLAQALRAVSPATVRDFYRLAAVQVRRELIDLARHYYGPEGLGARHHTWRSDADAPLPEPAAGAEVDPCGSWTEFHEAIHNLPDDEREMFDLLWYQGLAQAEAAEVLGVSERTVKRRWQAARVRLHEALAGEAPEL